MPTIASLTGKIEIQGASKARDDLKGISGHLHTAGSGLKGFVGQALSFGAAQLGVSSVGNAFGFVTHQLGDMISAGFAANRMDSILAQGLKSTHDASGQTVKSLDQLSTALMTHTGISDDAVKAGEQMLLTFTGIGKNAFPQATQAVADMATRMNGGAIPTAEQMSQTALQLGKALNDPAQGLMMLRREGVTFTQAQQDQIKAMVKAGNTAGAQKLMLKELSTEFGGSAEAAGKANGGIAIMTASMDNAKQQIGQALVPAVSNLTSTFAPLVVQLAQNLAPAITNLSDYLKKHQGVLVALAAIVGTVVVGAFAAWAVATIAATWPVLAIMAAIAGLTAGVIYAYTHWGWFRNAVNVARVELGNIWSFIQTKVLPILGNLAGKVGEAKDKFGDFLGVLGTIKDTIGDLIGKIGDLLGKLGSIHLPNLGDFHLPGFAAGGVMEHSGLAMVGESGAELVALPAGARVYSASQTRAIAEGSATPGSSSGASNTGGADASAGIPAVPVNIHIAGRNVATVLLPDLVFAARRAGGLRI